MTNLIAAIALTAVNEMQFDRGYEMGKTIAFGIALTSFAEKPFAEAAKAIEAHRTVTAEAWNAAPNARPAS
jgi:hypothetical protein